VGHAENELNPERTLERLYLDPLREITKRANGQVFPGGPEFTLLIDIKSDGPTTYQALRKVLAKYADMLTGYRVDKIDRRAVTVVISGNRPWEMIAADAIRYAAIDGRLEDLTANRPRHLVPLISDRWGSHFRWTGRGSWADDERQKLKQLVRDAHDQGQRIRFWATADTVEMWRELHAAGVDLINTDDLAGLSKFLREVR
jgi:glycerophosphoryl diester phosphodiesterase